MTFNIFYNILALLLLTLSPPVLLISIFLLNMLLGSEDKITLKELPKVVFKAVKRIANGTGFIEVVNLLSHCCI